MYVEKDLFDIPSTIMRYLLLFTLLLNTPLLSEETASAYSIEEEGEEGCALQKNDEDGPQQMSLSHHYSSRRCKKRPRCGDVDETWYDDDETSWPTRKDESWLDGILQDYPSSH